jgi:hypothetical protein
MVPALARAETLALQFDQQAGAMIAAANKKHFGEEAP